MFTFKPYLEYRLSLDSVQVSDIFWMIMRYVSNPDVVDEMDGYADYRNLCDVRTYAFYELRRDKSDMITVYFGKTEDGYRYSANVSLAQKGGTDIICVDVIGRDKDDNPDRVVLSFQLSDGDDSYDDILFEVVDYLTYRDGGPLLKASENTYRAIYK